MKWTSQHSLLVTLFLGGLKLWGILDLPWWLVTLPLYWWAAVIGGVALLAILAATLLACALLSLRTVDLLYGYFKTIRRNFRM